MRDYISHYSSRSPGDDIAADGSTRRRISLPDLVRQYRNAFAQSSNVGASADASADSSLVDGLEILNEDANVEYIAPDYAYEVVLTYSERNVSSVGQPALNVAEISSSWQTRRLRPNLLQYLEGHSWLLSYLLQRLHKVESPTILESSCDSTRRTACLENLLNSPWVDKLKPLFDDNRTLTAISDGIPARELWRYFEHRREDYDWEDSLAILDALADNAMRRDSELLRLRDLILSHLLSDPMAGARSTARMLRYVYQIEDIHILTRTILHNINKWPINVCEHALLHALQHEHNRRLPAHCVQRMNDFLCRITIFHKMIPYCVSRSNSTWYDVAYCTEKIDPSQIIKSLINADQFELCFEWLKCQAFSLEMRPTMIQDLLIGLLRNERNLDEAATELATKV